MKPRSLSGRGSTSPRKVDFQQNPVPPQSASRLGRSYGGRQRKLAVLSPSQLVSRAINEERERVVALQLAIPEPIVIGTSITSPAKYVGVGEGFGELPFLSPASQASKAKRVFSPAKPDYSPPKLPAVRSAIPAAGGDEVALELDNRRIEAELGAILNQEVSQKSDKAEFRNIKISCESVLEGRVRLTLHLSRHQHLMLPYLSSVFAVARSSEGVSEDVEIVGPVVYDLSRKKLSRDNIARASNQIKMARAFYMSPKENKDFFAFLEGQILPAFKEMDEDYEIDLHFVKAPPASSSPRKGVDSHPKTLPALDGKINSAGDTLIVLFAKKKGGKSNFLPRAFPDLKPYDFTKLSSDGRHSIRGECICLLYHELAGVKSEFPEANVARRRAEMVERIFRGMRDPGMRVETKVAVFGAAGKKRLQAYIPKIPTLDMATLKMQILADGAGSGIEDDHLTITDDGLVISFPLAMSIEAVEEITSKCVENCNKKYEEREIKKVAEILRRVDVVVSGGLEDDGLSLAGVVAEQNVGSEIWNAQIICESADEAARLRKDIHAKIDQAIIDNLLKLRRKERVTHVIKAGDKHVVRFNYSGVEDKVRVAKSLAHSLNGIRPKQVMDALKEVVVADVDGENNFSLAKVFVTANATGDTRYVRIACEDELEALGLRSKICNNVKQVNSFNKAKRDAYQDKIVIAEEGEDADKKYFLQFNHQLNEAQDLARGLANPLEHSKETQDVVTKIQANFRRIMLAKRVELLKAQAKQEVIKKATRDLAQLLDEMVRKVVVEQEISEEILEEVVLELLRNAVQEEIAEIERIRFEKEAKERDLMRIEDEESVINPLINKALVDALNELKQEQEEREHEERELEAMSIEEDETRRFLREKNKIELEEKAAEDLAAASELEKAKQAALELERAKQAALELERAKQAALELEKEKADLELQRAGEAALLEIEEARAALELERAKQAALDLKKEKADLEIEKERAALELEMLKQATLDFERARQAALLDLEKEKAALELEKERATLELERARQAALLEIEEARAAALELERAKQAAAERERINQAVKTPVILDESRNVVSEGVHDGGMTTPGDFTPDTAAARMVDSRATSPGDLASEVDAKVAPKRVRKIVASRHSGKPSTGVTPSSSPSTLDKSPRMKTPQEIVLEGQEEITKNNREFFAKLKVRVLVRDIGGESVLVLFKDDRTFLNIEEMEEVLGSKKIAQLLKGRYGEKIVFDLKDKTTLKKAYLGESRYEEGDLTRNYPFYSRVAEEVRAAINPANPLFEKELEDRCESVAVMRNTSNMATASLSAAQRGDATGLQSVAKQLLTTPVKGSAVK